MITVNQLQVYLAEYILNNHVPDIPEIIPLGNAICLLPSDFDICFLSDDPYNVSISQICILNTAGEVVLSPGNTDGEVHYNDAGRKVYSALDTNNKRLTLYFRKVVSIGTFIKKFGLHYSVKSHSIALQKG